MEAKKKKKKQKRGILSVCTLSPFFFAFISFFWPVRRVSDGILFLVICVGELIISMICVGDYY